VNSETATVLIFPILKFIIFKIGQYIGFSAAIPTSKVVIIRVSPDPDLLKEVIEPTIKTPL